METYAAKGFAAKEEKILELMEKNLELEKQVLELEESGKAKDELIRARTEAVSLMSADLSARGKTTLDELEETKIQVKEQAARFRRSELFAPMRTYCTHGLYNVLCTRCVMSSVKRAKTKRALP